MRILVLFAIVILVSLPNYSETNTIFFTKPQAFTVVIDPGHGGKDSGALGSYTKEKNIALKIALKLGAYIQKYLPEVRVLYTRTSDIFIPLHERTAFANRNNADVFLSIHCNALTAKQKHIKGTETYVMGLHNTTENLSVAKRENQAVLLEQDYKTNYDGYDPNSSEGHIMLSMFQNAYVNHSLLLAEQIESQFKNGAKRTSRGVKQAGFVVLRTATMPSVLIETGFLTNSIEESYLNSEQGQVYTASAIYRAFKGYKQQIASQPLAGWKSIQKTSTRTIASPSPKTRSLAFSKSNKPQTTYKTPIPNKKTKTATVVQNAPSLTQMYPSSLKIPSTQKTIFRVQLASSPTPVDVKKGNWTKVSNIECQKIGTSYKCLVGKHTQLNDAVNQQNYWRKHGYKDAFVVAFRDGKKISLQEALR